MIKSIVLCSSLMLSSVSTLALTNELPENCEFVRSTVNDVSSGEVVTAVKSGLAVYGNPYSPKAWASFAKSLSNLYDSYDYLKLEAPDHVIVGRDFRAKGNLFDTLAYVNFFNSEKGYVGRDKSNYEANAYFNRMRFDRTRGYGLVWIQRGDLCTAKGVWVQNKPTVKKISYSGTWYSGETTVSYSADPKFSKAALEKNKLGLRLKVTKRGYPDKFFYTDWTYVSNFSGKVTMSFSQPRSWGSSSVDVRAYINDGSQEDFAVVHARNTGVNPCSSRICDIEP